MGLWDMIFGERNQGGRKFKTGDKVRVKYRGQEGYIISVDGSLYMVSMNDGALVDYYTEDQLEKCSV